MIKHQVLPLLIFTTFFTSCIGPKKINKWVNKQYGGSIDAKPKTQNDYLSVTSGLITNNTIASVTTKQTKNVLPLIFYWQMDYILTCTLNPQIPINTFTSTILPYANLKGLKQKLNGQKIELSIDGIPNLFVLNDKGHIVWVVYAFGWDDISFRPAPKSLVVSYKILNNNNTETKKGTVTITNEDEVLVMKHLHSIKEATGQYLEQYDENIKTLTKKALDKIISEL
jgi:hypothetical protein